MTQPSPLPLNAKRLADVVSFSEAKMTKNVLFDSPHMFCDVYALLPGQAQKVHAHDGSDKVYVVLEGTGRFTIGEAEADFGPGHAVLAPAGEPHGVRNESEGKLVLLVTMAPKP